eukprot:15366161-Ditylum_brightwellii.AAC.1
MEAVSPPTLDSSFDASLDVAFNDELDTFEASHPFFFVPFLPFFEAGTFANSTFSSSLEDAASVLLVHS